MKTKVILLILNEQFREDLKYVIEKLGYEVAAAVSTTFIALQKLKQLKGEAILILDRKLKRNERGIIVGGDVTYAYPNAKVVLMSNFRFGSTLTGSLKEDRFAGHFTRDMSIQDYREALKEIECGIQYFPQEALTLCNVL